MPYPIVSDLIDGPVFPGYLYLPGQPTDEHCHAARCCYCDNPMSEGGSADPATGDVVQQHPATGRHDGVVTSLYPPMVGVSVLCTDYAHLRCVVEACESGMVALTIGSFDPEAPEAHLGYEPRHAA